MWNVFVGEEVGRWLQKLRQARPKVAAMFALDARVAASVLKLIRF